MRISQKALKVGASGVQIGTRFVASEECDAPLAFKQKYVDAQERDIMMVKKQQLGYMEEPLKKSIYGTD
ncbi:hypothetical protein GCM10020331_070910 [Ectobacillus funiculus]